MKDKWVIAYDLNVTAMKDAGYTESKVTQYYNKVKKCLSNYGFTRFTQGSIYGSDKEDNVLTDAYHVIDELRKIPDAKFVNRLHLFEVKSFSDLRTLLPDLKPSEESDPIKEKIEIVFKDRG